MRNCSKLFFLLRRPFAYVGTSVPLSLRPVCIPPWLRLVWAAEAHVSSQGDCSMFKPAAYRVSGSLKLAFNRLLGAVLFMLGWISYIFYLMRLVFKRLFGVIYFPAENFLLGKILSWEWLLDRYFLFTQVATSGLLYTEITWRIGF